MKAFWPETSPRCAHFVGGCASNCLSGLDTAHGLRDCVRRSLQVGGAPVWKKPRRDLHLFSTAFILAFVWLVIGKF